jgi:hypothetical protein
MIMPSLLNRLKNSKFKNPKTAKILFAVAVFIGIFFLALKPSTDPDLFWHLKTGELMWQYGTIPHIDWFSYTMSDYPRINFEWLSEILMFLIWKAAGFGGLAVFFALVITAAFGYFIPESIENHPFFLTRFLAIFGAFVSSLTFGSRPQMLSILGVSVMLFIIAKYRQNSQSKIVWFLPLLFLLWANMHGGFVFGIGFMMIFLALENFLIKQKERVPGAEWLKLYNPLARESWKKLFYSFLASLFLTLLNPYSWRLYREIYKAVSDTYDKNSIMEWLAPNFHTTEGIVFGFYVIFVFIILATIRKIDLLSFVFIPIVLFFAFQAGRNIPFFVIISIPFLAKSMAELENVFSDLLNKKLFAAAISGFLIFYLPLANNNAASAIKTFNGGQKQAEAGGYPHDALRFLLDSPSYREKNMFNSYGWGGYIIGSSKCKVKSEKLWCEPKVFIDGRMSYWKLPDRHILKDYTDIEYVSDGWEKLIDKYDISIIFINKKMFLGNALKFNNDWKNIYEDDWAVIYEKN